MGNNVEWVEEEGWLRGRSSDKDDWRPSLVSVIEKLLDVLIKSSVEGLISTIRDDCVCRGSLGS